MTSYVPPTKNGSSGWIGYVGLTPLVTTGAFQANPTLAAGDVKISIDGGAFANLGTLPAVTPAAGKAVKITLSQAETNGDNLVIIFSDQTSPAEWCDLMVELQTSARSNDDLAFPNTSGRGIDVTAGGEVGIDWANIGSPTTTVNLSGTTIKAVTDAVSSNVTQWSGTNVLAPNVAGVPRVDISYIKGAVSAGAAGYAGIDWSAINAPTTVVNLSGTTIKTATDIAAQIAALVIPTANQNADALLGRTDGIETGITPQQGWRVILGATAGKADGFTGAAATVHYRNQADTLNRITADVDEFGNRTTVTLNTG